MRSGIVVLLGLASMLLALAGCAFGNRPRTADVTTAPSSVAPGVAPAAEMPGTNSDVSRSGARPLLQQGKPSPRDGKIASGKTKAPVSQTIPLAPTAPVAIAGPAVALLPATAKSVAGRSAPISKPNDSVVNRPTAAARRDRAVETVQFQAEQPRTAAFAPDAEFLEEPVPPEPPAAPESRRRRRRRSDAPQPDPEPVEIKSPQTSDEQPGNRLHIPLDDSAHDDRIELTPVGDRITLVVREAPLSSVLNLLAKQRGLNVIVGDDTESKISVTLTDVDFSEAWSAIIEISGCTWTQSNNIIMVTSISADSRTSPQYQDRQLRVFPLNFVDAKDVQLVVKGLLSPAGQVFTMQTLPKERRSTQETVVVEDIPPYLKRIADYIAAVDVPPRQVMIEVHILQITLEDDCTHGVNLQYLFGAGGNNVVMSTVGFANPAAATASLFTVSGEHFNSVIQALQTTTDSKTLASPKVIVANGQQARIQIGQRFGYFVTTTTQTSTLQNVNFLNTGVVLAVTPQISADNQVLMSVTPEVSTGQITNGLPQTETTTTDTTVLLPDGAGMVIGGLIKEQDIETQNKVPLLGDLRVIGRLFQMRTVTRQRVEIIIAILPRIAPYPPGYEVQHQIELEQAFTPLMRGPLNRAPRPFEAQLPDAYANPRNLRLNRLPDAVRNLRDPYPLPLSHFFPSAQEEHPPVVPPAPGPQLKLSLPPAPGPLSLPPVDVIIPDASPAAPVERPASAKVGKTGSARGRRVKGKPQPAQPAVSVGAQKPATRDAF